MKLRDFTKQVVPNLIEFSSFSGKAAAGVAVSVLSGLLEGSAMLCLIPIIENLTQRSTPGTFSFLDRFGWSALSPASQTVAGIVLFGALGFFSALTKFVSQYLLSRLEFSVAAYAMKRTADALLDTQWSVYLGLRAGEVHKALLHEGFRIAMGIRQLLAVAIEGAIALAMAMVCALLSWQMTLCSVAFGVLGTAGFAVFGRRVKHKSAQLHGAETAVAHRVSEVFENLKFFRLRGKEETAKAQLNREFEGYRVTGSRLHFLGHLARFLADAGSVLFIALFIALGVFWAQLPAARLFVFLAIFYRLIPRVVAANNQMIATSIELRMLRPWRSRLSQAETRKAPGHMQGVVRFLKEIAFQDVSLDFGASERPVLDRINLRIPKGTFLGVVGPSGSGKTSLIDVLAGLYPPTSGSVLIDGLPLAELPITSWQNSLGVVLQHNPVFYGSFIDNIAWGERSPDLGRVHAAARLADAAEFIVKFPDGFNTKIGPGGVTLSGGQVQRIAIARALYQQPAVLILDEPTSALDSAAEDTVLTAVERSRGECTNIMVSHRLKSVRTADTIVVLDNGRVIEQGTWEELLRNPEGAFYRLARAQGLVE